MFQFLYGAIKRFRIDGNIDTGQAFQFLYGAIKSINPGVGRTGINRFNSSMVRLKEDGTLPFTGDQSSFNSSMVRLKDGGGLASIGGINVSIPLWCD